MFEAEALPSLAKGARDAYHDSLKPIRRYFVDKLKDPTVDRIHAKQVTGFLSWRRVNRLRGRRRADRFKSGAPVTNRTLAKDRAVLHRLFALAEKMEYRDGNPVGRVDAPKDDGRTPVILSADEYDRLLAESKGRPMLALYVLLLGETGMRCESEALRLRWEDVDLDEGFIQVVSGRDGHRTKGGRSRFVPMTARLLAAMREHFAAYHFAAYGGERTLWVFHHDRTRRHYRAGTRIGTLHVSFLSAAARAKLPAGLRQHDLRHRRVTTWLGDGKNPVLVKEAMGHADLRTTMGYTHLVKEHLRALVEHSQPATREKVARGSG